MKIRRMIVGVIMALLMCALATTPAFAQQVGACFSVVAKGGGNPGAGVSTLSTTLAEPGTAESEVDEAATNIGVVQQVREDIC
jgi:hypothetical protein